ncbi:MAG: acyl carrier protein [Syntrophales bacterium]
MNETFKKIKQGIQNVFPDMGNVEITPETRLGEIPDFDSMAAVNLQTCLEEMFRLSIPLDLLNEEMTVGELAAYIEQPEKMRAAGGK